LCLLLFCGRREKTCYFSFGVWASFFRLLNCIHCYSSSFCFCRSSYFALSSDSRSRPDPFPDQPLLPPLPSSSFPRSPRPSHLALPWLPLSSRLLPLAAPGQSSCLPCVCVFLNATCCAISKFNFCDASLAPARTMFWRFGLQSEAPS
jgi:hypothetical protein